MKYYSNMDFVVYFGYTEEEINTIFPLLASDKKIPYTDKQDTYVTDYIKLCNESRHGVLKGWFGSVLKPNQLKARDYDFNNVVVYIHGKIADENIFKDSGNARFAANYLVGEIQADFLHSEDSPVTSSRQGLDTSEDDIAKFIEHLKIIRTFFIEKWSELRIKNAPSYIPEELGRDIKYKQWLDKLDKSKRQIHDRLVHLILGKIVDQDEKLETGEARKFLKAIVDMVEDIEVIKLEQALNSAKNNEHYAILSCLMDKIATNEIQQTFELIKKRLFAVNKLERLMKDAQTNEKIFQNHLYKNPWLIEPYWNRKIEGEDGFELVKEAYYKKINIKTGDFEKCFIDLLIRSAEEEYPIIIELKKNQPTGHAKVTRGDIINQISKYRKALKQACIDNLEKTILEQDFKAYLIISEDTGPNNTIELSPEEFKLLSQENIHVVKYNKMLEKAKNSYSEFINLIKKRSEIPFSDFDD